MIKMYDKNCLISELTIIEILVKKDRRKTIRQTAKHEQRV